MHYHDIIFQVNVIDSALLLIQLVIDSTQLLFYIIKAPNIYPEIVPINITSEM